MKHIELFKDGFDDTLIEKTQPENWPYIGYDMVTGEIVCTVIPENNQIEYQMIDLGLPSGIKWADKNVGAETSQDNGLYFSWGNVEGHAVDENGNTVDGYSFDNNIYTETPGGQYTGSTLDAEHDAATVNMGEGWSMPTNEEINELFQSTDHYYIGENGSIVAGPFNYETNYEDKGLDRAIKLRSICFVKKGDTFDYNDRTNFLEIPIAGNCCYSTLYYEGDIGGCWSSFVYESSVNSACCLYFLSDGRLTISKCNRYLGLPVRGVHA